VKINVKMVGVAALAAVVIVGGYFAASSWDQQRSSASAAAPGPIPDAGPEQDRRESVPAPHVSTDFQQLPESKSVGVSPPRHQQQTSGASSNSN
jgi:hypothetical protein